MKKLALALFICFFILLRPYILDSSGMWYPGDDQDYFAHASNIIFGQYPSYKKEYLIIDPNYPQSSIGSGLLAVPFVFVFSMIDRITYSSIIEQRTAQNIPGSWSQFGFVFASCFYFCFACFFLYLVLRRFVQEKIAFYAILLTVLCEGIPLFALRRPIFSHMTEFFLQSLFVFLILHCSQKPSNKRPLWFFAFLGIAGALVFLTRYNNIVFALLMPLCIFVIVNKGQVLKDLWLKLSIMGASFLSLVLLFKIWPEHFNHYQPYKWAKDYLTPYFSFSQWIERIGHVLFGLDWGLVFTAPFVIVGLIGIFLVKHPAKKYLITLSGCLLVNFYIILVWGSQGGWYGYRYLIVSAIPIAVVGVAYLMDWVQVKFKKGLSLYWLLIAVLPFLSMTSYEGNNSTLDLNTTQVQLMGRSDFTNNLYQYHVWQNFLFAPFDYMGILLKGGFTYVHYLIVGVLQHVGLCSNAYFREYRYFSLMLLIKMLLLYAMPFCFYLFFIRFSERK